MIEDKIKVGFMDEYEIISVQSPSILLHSKRPKLHRVLAVLSAIGLEYKSILMRVTTYWYGFIEKEKKNYPICL